MKKTSFVRALILTLVLLLLSACGGLKDQLVGSWAIDFDAMFDRHPDLKAMGANPQARDMIKEKLGGAGITFTDDTVSFTGPTADDTMTGPYTIVSEEGQRIVISSKTSKEGDLEQWFFEFSDEDHVKGGELDKGEFLFLMRRK